jgi:hypothetical protein
VPGNYDFSKILNVCLVLIVFDILP